MKLSQYPKPKRKGFNCFGYIRKCQSENRWKYDFRHHRYYYCVINAVISFRDFAHCEKYRNGIQWSNAAWLLDKAW